MLRQLKYFIEVAQHLSFTAAAHHLNISQPTISQQIVELEKMLGFSLFKRNNRSVVLSQAGIVFLTEAKKISESLEAAVLKASKAQKGEIGELRIGVIDAAVAHFLPNIIRLYKMQYPEIIITIQHMNPLLQLKAFEEGKIDVGFSRSFNSKQYNGLEHHIVYKDKIVAVFSKDHPLADRKNISISELKNESFILFSRNETEGFFDLMIRFCQEIGNFCPYVGHEPVLLQTLFLLVESGLGVSLIPSCARYLNNNVSIVNIKDQSPEIPLNILYKKNNMTPASKSFLSLFNENISLVTKD